MHSESVQQTPSAEETSKPQEPLYVGAIGIELTGLAIMRQRRTLCLVEPLGRSAVEALARETERNHVWDYQNMQEETIDVLIRSQPALPPDESVPDEEAPVMAYLAPDQCPGVWFDARPWLKQAHARDIRNLRETAASGHYLSDELAQESREYTPDVEAVLAYCETIDCGFTCAVSIQATEAWISRYRPAMSEK